VNVETECLFYRALRTFLIQSPEFYRDFSFLQEQYNSFPESFKSLSPNNLIRFDMMKKSFSFKKFILFEGASITDPPVLLPPDKEKSEMNHQTLIREILRTGALDPFIGTGAEICPEYPVDYGLIDLFAVKDSCAYIIEVKTETADHSIVGQVLKYYVGVGLRLILKHFDDIRTVTVCPGYNQAAVFGLKQLKTLMLLQDPKTAEIRPLITF
jgi:hypothetical protein